MLEKRKQSQQYVYNYIRHYNENYGWMIQNETKKDSEGNPILIENIVKDMFIGYKFSLVCVCDKATFYFEIELTPAQKELLDDLVASYQIPEGEV